MNTKEWDEIWSTFEVEGYAVLPRGSCLSGGSDEWVERLRRRLDEIMLGNVETTLTDKLIMQLDTADGSYASSAPQTLGHKGSSTAYRKIQNLEVDDVFRAYLTDETFVEASRRAYGDNQGIGLDAGSLSLSLSLSLSTHPTLSIPRSPTVWDFHTHSISPEFPRGLSPTRFSLERTRDHQRCTRWS